MRYDQPELREMLAAEYAMGSLRGAARRRYQALLLTRKDWQRSSEWWAHHLHLLADTVPAVKPRREVWNIIETRLYGLPARQHWWRRLALLSSTLAAALAVVLAMQPLLTGQPTPVPVSLPQTSIALLNDEAAKAGWMLALQKNADGSTDIRAVAMAGISEQADKAFELWVLPGDKSKPVSLGLLPKSGQASLRLKVDSALLYASNGLAVSLEPTGGSPTGQPTGPVLYQGKLTRL